MHIARIIDQNDRKMLVRCQPDTGELTQLTGDPYHGSYEDTGENVVVKTCLSPVVPRMIFCIGKNYAAHIKEFDGAEIPEYPVVFCKNPHAVTGHQRNIKIPKVCDDEVDYEGELAVVIGKATRNVSPEQARGQVLGYTIANDVSARIWQKEKGIIPPWMLI